MKVLWLVVVALSGCAEAPAVPPEVVSGTVIPFPEELWDANVEGETLLRVHVTETGAADSVRVERSSGYEGFDRAALRGARALRFTAGRRGDEPVAMWVRIPVHFRLQPEAP